MEIMPNEDSTSEGSISMEALEKLLSAKVSSAIEAALIRRQAACA